MDETWRRKLRDPWLTRDQKLQTLLDYSRRAGVAIGDLDVLEDWEWDYDEYRSVPGGSLGPERETFRWTLPNKREVTLTKDWHGVLPPRTSFIIREPQTLYGNATLHLAIMNKYAQYERSGAELAGRGPAKWALFSTGSDLPYPAPPHAYLLPQKPFDLKKVIQIVLLEALAAD